MIKSKTVKSKTVQVYNWFDIQEEMCKEMNISEIQFRDVKGHDGHFYKWADAKGYGQIDPAGEHRGSSNIWFTEYNNDPAGKASRPEYCDFWHVALDTIIPDTMHNDSTVTMFPLEDYEDEKESYLSDHGDWTAPFFESYNKIMLGLDPGCNGIEVEFSW